MKSLKPLECRGNYSATSNGMNFEVGTLAFDRSAVTFGTAMRGLLLNVTAQPSTASLPITVMLYNGPLLCGFNVSIKG